MFAGAGGAISLLPCGALRAEAPMARVLRSLVWDRERAARNWNRAGGARWVLHDDVPIFWGGRGGPRNGPASPPLSALERTQIADTLREASRYYLTRGLPPPMLPLDADDAFHIFYLDFEGAILGGTGPGMGDEVGAGAGYGEPTGAQITAVPEGIHIMMSARLYRDVYPEHPLQPRITLAHELIHAIDHYAAGPSTWEKVGGWVGEGSTHAIAQFSIRQIGYDPELNPREGSWAYTKEIGLRPYDVPLPIKERPPRRPAWVRAERPPAGGLTEADMTARFWDTNATYFTDSFWRFLFKEEAPVRNGAPVSIPRLPQGMFHPPLKAGSAAPTRPGDFELFAPFRAFKATDEDRRQAGRNVRFMDPGIPMLNRFLKSPAHPHPVWAAPGLYRALPAFIAHIIEWPDQVAESRSGYLAHEKWLAGLFMDGVPKYEIAAGKDIEADLGVVNPLAARAFRFELPPENLLGSARYPKVTITLIVQNGHAEAIDHFHVGLRGNVLANLEAQTRSVGAGKVRRWTNVDARPLMRRSTKGETVISVTNIAPDISMSKPLRVTVHVALQVADLNGQCSYHPLPVPDEAGRMVPLPSSVSPPAGKTVPTMAVERGMDEIEVSITQDADLVEIQEAAGAIAGASQFTVLRKTDDSDPPGAGMNAERLQMLAAKATLVTTKSRLIVTLILPRVEPGQIGAIQGAKARVEWIDPVYQPYIRLGASRSVTMETDAVQVTLTSNGEGNIAGTYAANFDNASGNDERVFRGVISGKFSMGIARDEAQGEGDLPPDKTAIMPTDFFIGAARSGLDTAMIGRMLEQAAQEAGVDASTGKDVGGSAADRTEDRDIAIGRDTPDAECTFRDQAQVRDFLDKFLRKSMGGSTDLQPGQLEQIRDAMLADGDTAQQLLCQVGFHPGAAK